MTQNKGKGHFLFLKKGFVTNDRTLVSQVQMKKVISLTSKKLRKSLPITMRIRADITRTKRSINRRRNISINTESQELKNIPVEMMVNQIPFGLKRLMLPLKKLLDFTENLIWQIECTAVYTDLTLLCTN